MLFFCLFYQQMVNIKKLGNKQLGYYHETIYHQIYDIQDDILEDIYDIL
jgi:hypothetical protein